MPELLGVHPVMYCAVIWNVMYFSVQVHNQN